MQLSLKAALPLAGFFATASDHCSKTGSNSIRHRDDTVRPGQAVTYTSDPLRSDLNSVPTPDLQAACNTDLFRRLVSETIDLRLEGYLIVRSVRHGANRYYVHLVTGRARGYTPRSVFYHGALIIQHGVTTTVMNPLAWVLKVHNMT